MKNMKKILALALVVMSIMAITIPAMALSGGYDSAKVYLSTSTLKPGYGTVRAVTNLQYMLIDLGYNPGSVDGIYGPQTAAAVSAYQRDNGSLSVDGQCGKNTKIAIWEDLVSLPSGCY